MQSTIVWRRQKMSDKPIKSENKKINKNYLKWIAIGFAVVVIECIAIGGAYFIIESKNKSQQLAFDELVRKLSQQNVYISELQNLPAIISANTQRISATEDNLMSVTENFNELKNEVGNNKFGILMQQFGVFAHKLEALEETKNSEALALSVALIIKENALYHRSFANETEILAQLTQNQPILTSAIQTISDMKTYYIPDDLQLAARFNDIAENLDFENDKNVTQQNGSSSSESAVAKSIALIKDTVAGLNFDRVVVVKKNIQNDEQAELLNELTTLVEHHDFAKALKLIKNSPDFQKLNNSELNTWIKDVERKISFDEALSFIITSELNALRQDFSDIRNNQ